MLFDNCKRCNETGMSTERRAGLSALAELLGNNTDNNVLVPTGFVLMIILKRKKISYREPSSELRC